MTSWLPGPRPGVSLAGAMLVLGACASAPSAAPTVAPPVTSPPSEQEAYERARPVFERHCASCHTSSAGERAALRHFSMDGYPFGGHHAGQISGTIREVLGASGKPVTMPKDRPGAVQAEELRAILDWADAFDRAHAARNHNEHHHDH
jgi:mono/diheme cytochrome c family protein